MVVPDAFAEEDETANVGRLTVNGEQEDVLILTGANTFTGKANVQSGNVILDGGGSLATNDVDVDAGASLTITESNGGANGLAEGATVINDGVVNLSANDEIATLNNTGTVNGVIVEDESVTALTADTFNLNGGSVINADLIGDETANNALNSNGDVLLNGRSTVIDTNVETGTLTLGAAERLSDDTNLNVADDAVVILGGDEQIATLNDLADQGGEVNTNGNTFSVNSGEFSGEITDGAGDDNIGLLTVNGENDDILTLTGANTFTGEANVQSGNLTLNESGSLATNDVDVDAGASLTISESNGGINGLVEGASLTNDGVVNLNANDEITTLNNTGTVNGLIVAEESTTSLTATTFNLSNGSVINADLVGEVAVANVLNSNGEVTLNGRSTVIDTNVETGILTLGAAERLNDTTNLNLAEGAVVALGGDEEVGVVTGEGEINFNSHDLTLGSNVDSEFAGTFTNSELSSVNIDAGVVTFNQNLGNAPLSLDTLNVNDLSELNIVGDTSIFVGAGDATQDGLPANGINISEGAVLSQSNEALISANNIHVDGIFNVLNSENLTVGVIDGSGDIIADNFINKTSGTISGNLNFSGDVVNNGILSPGNSPGVISIAGNLENNGVIEIEVNDTTQEAGVGFDQVSVGNAITLGEDSVLQVVTTESNPSLGEVAQFFTNSSNADAPVEIAGAFGKVESVADLEVGPTENAALVFDTNTGEAIFTGLNAANSQFSDISSDSNEAAIFVALLGASEDELGRAQIDSSDGSVGDFIRTALVSGSVTSSFAGFVPELYAAGSEYAFEGARQRDQNLLTIFNTPQEYGKWSLFTDNSYSNFETVNGNDADATRRSFTLGSSYSTVNNYKIGFIASHNDGDIDSSRDGSIDIDGEGVTAFISHKRKNTTSFLSLGYESNGLDLSRNTQQGVVSASTDSDLFSITAGLEHVIYASGKASVRANMALSYDNYSTDSFTERGSVDALNHGDTDHDYFSGTLGVTAAYETYFMNRLLNVSADLGTTFVISDQSDRVDLSLVDNPDVRFGFEALDQVEIRADIGVGVQYELFKNQWLGMSYSAGLGAEVRQNVNVNYTINF